MKTINTAPSWHYVVKLYLEALEDKKRSKEDRDNMKKEILRAADLADIYVDLQK